MSRTFKSLEHQGWSERAAVYDTHTARFTSYGIDPLLDAIRIAPGLSVLDVCCGTGLAAQAAASKGARVTGIDISSEMIALARAKSPDCDFRVGDAEALPFENQFFDRVICNFGLFHLPEPDRAMAEAARVLRPGGIYAFTTWRGPDVSPLFRIVPEAIQAHGIMDVGLPPAPPPFRLANKDESAGAMRAAGFADMSFVDVAAVFECKRAQVTDFLAKSTVRTTMVLQAQAPEVRLAIDRSIEERLGSYAVGDTLKVPLPALLVAGRRSA
jgi:SAM-dependent methyltransferase